MEKRLRVFWGILFLLGIGWIAFGLVSTAETSAAPNEAAAQIESLAAGLGMANAGVFVLVTGLPLCIIAALLLWRSSVKITAEPTKRKAPGIRRQTLLIAILALGFAFVLWNAGEIDRATAELGIGIPALETTLVYPLRLFVTFIHEASHALAALITGGQVQGFTVSSNGAGYAVTAGGNLALILPAGYLGAALFGSLLFYLSNQAPRRVRGLSIFIGLALILLTVIYARPDQTGSLTAFTIGIGFGLIMIVMGWNAPRLVNLFFLNTLALMTALNAVLDLQMLTGNPNIGGDGMKNDAAAFAEEFTPLFPASVVALLWAVAAVFMLGIAIYAGLFKPLRQEISEAVSGE